MKNNNNSDSITNITISTITSAFFSILYQSHLPHSISAFSIVILYFAVNRLLAIIWSASSTDFLFRIWLCFSLIYFLAISHSFPIVLSQCHYNFSLSFCLRFFIFVPTLSSLTLCPSRINTLHRIWHIVRPHI